MSIDDILRCSFCAKSQREVGKIVAGPTVYICEECISICIEILAKGDDKIAQQMRIIRSVFREKYNVEEWGLIPPFQQKQFKVVKNKCFILCPFKDPFNTIYHDHLSAAAERAGYISLRADDIYGVKPIMEDIWTSINESGIIVAELTGRNPNVMYEVGMAHTVGKPVILITQNKEDVPFDLKHYRYIYYQYTPRGCRALEEQFAKTLLSIAEKKLS